MASLCFVLASPEGHAQWLTQEHASEFSSTKTYVSMTVSGEYFFAVRCRDAGSINALFLTPEIVDQMTMGKINQGRPELLVRFDAGPITALPVTGEAGPTDSGYFGQVGPEFLGQLRDANQRAVVALRFAGQVFHETEFNVLLADQAVADLSKNCVIPLF